MIPESKTMRSDDQIDEIEKRMRKEMLGVLESFKQELLDAKTDSVTSSKKFQESDDETKLSMLQKKLAWFEAYYDRMEYEREKTIENISKWQARTGQLIEENKELMLAAKQAQEELASNRKNVDDFVSQAEEFKKKYHELLGKQDATNHIRQEANASREKMLALEKQNEELVAALERKSAEISALQATKQELAHAKEHVQELTDRNLVLVRENETLQKESQIEEAQHLKNKLAWFEDYYARMEDERSEIIKELKEWKDHATRLLEENKQLMLSSEKTETLLEQKTNDLERVAEKAEELKLKYHELLDKEDSSVRLKRELNDAKEKILTLEEQKEEIKRLQPEKDVAIKKYREELAKRDEMLKTIDKQVQLLREEKHVVDKANETLLEKVSQLKRVVDKLNSDLEVKDDEVASVRALLTSEKEMEHKRLKQKLSEIAKIEARKEVLLTTRVKELMDVVAKQRDVIKEFATTDVQLAESFQAVINDTKQKRSIIDYSIVDKEFDEVAVDSAAISRVIDSIGAEPQAAEATTETPEVETVDAELASTIRRGLQNGDPPDVIKRSLIESGKNKTEVEKALQIEADKLNLKV